VHGGRAELAQPVQEALHHPAAVAAADRLREEAAISGAGFKLHSIDTEDSVYIDKKEDGFDITRIDTSARAFVEGIDEAAFLKLAEDAKLVE
jgi:organic hydroperoxide reductase OsmC/OhrA